MKNIKEYDVIIVGSGSGKHIVPEAVSRNLKVALVDKGPLGGTCPNSGCVPSKMLIYPADRIAEIQEAEKFGIKVEISNIDFDFIMGRMRKSVAELQSQTRESFSQLAGLDLYEGEGYFVADHTLEVNGEQIKGEKIFIACGLRSFIPPIKGVDCTNYLTSESVLQLKEKPDSIIIIGGGYIAVEYGHFFAAMGTKVTVLEMTDRLVPTEELEISDLLKRELSKRMDVHTHTRAKEIKEARNRATVIAKDEKTGREREFTGQRIMMCVGRKSNADLLKVENTGVDTDEKGFIKINEYLETNKKNIFAVGDVTGQHMFAHMANREALVAAYNSLHNEKIKMDYSAICSAVFSHPQIASVGLTEEHARKHHQILVGRAKYSDIIKGRAMAEESGFAKAIVERNSKKILGFHIIGPCAPILIQEVINIITSGGGINDIHNSIHIHPALPELIEKTISNLEEA